jgi:GNAT superfamily N-acetyltransferase
MTITRLDADKKRVHLDLLHLCEENDAILDGYLDRGEMFVVDDPDTKGECIVTKEGDGLYEIKNISVEKASRNKGYGTALIAFVLSHYPDLATLTAGIPQNEDLQRFYLHRGFFQAYRIRHYFRANYGVEDDDDDLLIYYKTKG